MTPRSSTSEQSRRPRYAPTTVNTENDEHDPLLARFTRYSAQGNLPRHRRHGDKGLSAWSDRTRRVREYLCQDLSVRHADLVLLACFLLNGLIDAGAYNAYECFVGMVTGNTIFLALGVSELPISAPLWAWTKSLCSIVAFFLGTFFFSTLHHVFGKRRRWTLFASFLLQGLMVLVSAVMLANRQTSESPSKPPVSAYAPSPPADPGFPWADLVPISLLSFQASAKILSSRLLEFPHLATVVLTVLYCDLLSDPALFTAGIFANPKRNQRVGGAVLYFVGAVLGGVLVKSHVGFEGALWITTASNLVIAAVWMLWPCQAGDSENECE